MANGRPTCSVYLWHDLLPINFACEIVVKQHHVRMYSTVQGSLACLTLTFEAGRVWLALSFDHMSLCSNKRDSL